MTIEQIGASMGVELKTFEKETQNEDGNTTTVTCVDMRDLLQAMVSGGMLEKDQLLSMRGELNSMLDACLLYTSFPVGKNASRRPHCGEGGDVISDAEKKGWAIWISR